MNNGQATGVPFACLDHECCDPEIAFSNTGPDGEGKAAIVEAFCDLLTQATPRTFISEGLEWGVFDRKEECEIGITHVSVGFDGSLYYNCDLEFPEGSWLMPDGEPTCHNELRARRLLRKVP